MQVTRISFGIINSDGIKDSNLLQDYRMAMWQSGIRNTLADLYGDDREIKLTDATAEFCDRRNRGLSEGPKIPLLRDPGKGLKAISDKAREVFKA